MYDFNDRTPFPPSAGVAGLHYGSVSGIDAELSFIPLLAGPGEVSGQVDEDSQSRSYIFQGAVAGPQLRSRRHKAGCEQVRVCETNTLRVESVRLNHVLHFVERGNIHFEQRLQVIQHFLPVVQRAKRNLRNDEGVHPNLPSAQEPLHLRVAVAKVVNPNRSVGQDHRLSALTRLMSSKSGSVPPTAASRREASR